MPERQRKQARVAGTVRRELNVPQALDAQINEVADTKGFSYNAVAVKGLQDYIERGPLINLVGHIHLNQSLLAEGTLRNQEMLACLDARMDRIESMLERVLRDD